MKYFNLKILFSEKYSRIVSGGNKNIISKISEI
jgi:hypothetical protein